MTWWATTEQGKKLEVKQKFNFKLYIDEFVVTAKSVDKPKATIEQKEFKLINHYYKYPGVVKWESISVVIIDSKSDDGQYRNGSKKLWEMLLASGYKIPDGAEITNNDFLTTPAKNLFKSQTFNDQSIKIEQIDHEGAKIETWELFNPIITKIDWGSNAYGDDSIIDLTLTIDYDYAKLT